jgi:fatty acid desaturase
MRPTAEIRDRLIHWQRNTAPTPLLHASLTLLQPLLWGAAVWTWSLGWYWATAVVWVASTTVAHNKLIAYHEAAHGLLQPIHWLNELIGQILGCVTMVPLTAYRIVHAQHHAYLGTERDVEFWPFVDPAVPRWRRVLAVVGELLFGYFYDPYVFLRGVCVARDIPAAQRRRAFREYAAVALVWCAVAVILTWRGWWLEFCVAFFIPGYVAAGLNSARRMTEHLGMLGDTVEGKTRTVIPVGRAESVISAAALRVNYHTVHHRYGRIPYYHLAEATHRVYAGELQQLPVFPSYWRAFLDMLPHVANPRIGGQWRPQQ